MAVPDGWRNHTARRTSAEVDPPLISRLRGAGSHGSLHVNKQGGEGGGGERAVGSKEHKEAHRLACQGCPDIYQQVPQAEEPVASD